MIDLLPGITGYKQDANSTHKSSNISGILSMDVPDTKSEPTSNYNI